MDPDREIGFVEKQRSSKAQNGRVTMLANK